MPSFPSLRLFLPITIIAHLLVSRDRGSESEIVIILYYNRVIIIVIYSRLNLIDHIFLKNFFVETTFVS